MCTADLFCSRAVVEFSALLVMNMNHFESANVLFWWNRKTNNLKKLGLGGTELHCSLKLWNKGVWRWFSWRRGVKSAWMQLAGVQRFGLIISVHQTLNDWHGPTTSADSLFTGSFYLACISLLRLYFVDEDNYSSADLEQQWETWSGWTPHGTNLLFVHQGFTVLSAILARGIV